MYVNSIYQVTLLEFYIVRYSVNDVSNTSKQYLSTLCARMHYYRDQVACSNQKYFEFVSEA